MFMLINIYVHINLELCNEYINSAFTNAFQITKTIDESNIVYLMQPKWLNFEEISFDLSHLFHSIKWKDIIQSNVQIVFGNVIPKTLSKAHESLKIGDASNGVSLNQNKFLCQSCLGQWQIVSIEDSHKCCVVTFESPAPQVSATMCEWTVVCWYFQGSLWCEFWAYQQKHTKTI